MFVALLTRFSPVATVYHSLYVVKYAYDATQTEQVQETFNYDPFADVDQETFISHEIEDDFLEVDKSMEDVDEDYCHLAIETKPNKSSSISSAAPLVNGAYDLARTLICGVVVSCDFVRYERKYLQDFVQEKSEKMTRAPIIPPAQPKTRGFGTDFGDGVPGIKFGLSASNNNIKHYAQDVKSKKNGYITANICLT